MRVKANLVKGLLCVLFLTLPVQAKYGGGSGEPNDPYLIYTAEQMNTIGAELNDWDKNFKLMDDVDLSGFTGTDFNIIGTPYKPFSGVFDGNGHTISNFSYTTTGRFSNGGLFRIVGGVIKNLGLINPNVDVRTGSDAGSLVDSVSIGTISNCYAEGASVSGDDHVGGLVGYNYRGTITNCTSSGSVSGNDDVGGLVGRNDGLVTASYSRASVTGWDEVGGLVGHNSYRAEIIDCYAGGEVLGQRYVGGLVGNNASQSGRGGSLYSGTIRNCYSAVAVSGDEQVGGLIGRNGDGGVSGSFWDIETSGQTTSDGGVGKTTAEMQNPNTFIDAGWDFAGAPDCPSHIWAEPDGGGYPVFWWQLHPLPVQAKYGGGSGEPNDPYLIYTAEQMNEIGTEPNDWDKHFKLMADIDLSSYTETDFNIIGTGYLPAFTGVFDGNGHTISNFTYTSTDLPCVGIFGYIDGPDARISNLGMIDPNVDAGTGIGVGSLAGWIEMGTITNCYVVDGSVSGEGYVGGLVGKNTGSITDCYATGSVTGISRIGGLVGSSYGTITDCYATGSVSGVDDVGGLVGTNYDATVTNCYSTCSVDGRNDVGGLVGTNSGNIVTCYSHCIVDAEDKVGGLVGVNNGIVTASCSFASIKGRDEVGGLVGRNSYHGEIVDCYSNGDVLGQRHVGGLVGNNHLVVFRGGEQDYGTVRTCYSATAVSGDQQIGGLVGYDQGGGVRDCFWDMETSGQTTSDGGTGKTTTELQMVGTFLDANWDFVDETQNGTEDIWSICEGTNYPRLTWQIPAGDFVCPDGFTIEDFLFFAEYWRNENCDLSNDYCQGTDLDFSGTVDADDLGILLENWLAEGKLEN